MYNQYNPYLNQYCGQQMMNRPQPMEMSMGQQTTPQIGLNRAFLNGKQVDSIETVKSMDIPLDGSISYFPIANGSAIVTKQLQQDGTSKITIYEPKEQKETKEEKLDLNKLDDIQENLIAFKREIKEELKEIKSKLKSKKEG